MAKDAGEGRVSAGACGRLELVAAPGWLQHRLAGTPPGGDGDADKPLPRTLRPSPCAYSSNAETVSVVPRRGHPRARRGRAPPRARIRAAQAAPARRPPRPPANA